MEKPPQPQSIDEALQWHTAITASSISHRSSVLSALREGRQAGISASFLGRTELEIDNLFDKERAEIDGMCIVNIVAAAEAAVLRDYRQRTRENRANPLSRAYAAFKSTLAGRKVWRPDFDRGGILDVIADSQALPRHIVTEFRHALKIRHWYAHGRHWLLSTNAIEDPVAIHLTCRALLTAISA